ncbi:DnaT-like ssDNA-binding protein [Paenibacillus naphthalenovorans]|uniref:DnaT-like ssDNA-binding protein n=1 Tax=Paenibacillus naphthalenovorans TaxID=162209 RepID=UPI003D2D8394
MALIVGTNSYVSVDDADIYFADRLFADKWESATPLDKEKALIMATRKIDMQLLNGRKVDSAQTLQFPRSIYSRYKYPPYPQWVDESEVSDDVKSAVCEEALAILSYTKESQKRTQLQRQGVTSFSLGSLSESYSSNNATGYKLLSVEAVQLLAPYIGGSRVIV